ncbi:hypothetical protein H0H92_013548 [Tricholoma furcatifolium]|nr:hypothetical protein H0H92_013548 [Tricholoma furcatifolium]
MPLSNLPTRSQQPTSSKLGKQFTSPLKRRNKAKTTTYMDPIGRKEDISRLRSQVEALKRRASGVELLSSRTDTWLDGSESTSPPYHEPEAPADVNDVVCEETLPTPEYIDEALPAPDYIDEAERTPRRTQPNQTAKDLYTNWKNLLSRLVLPFMEYNSKTIGKIPDRRGAKGRGAVDRKRAKFSAYSKILTGTLTTPFADFQRLSVDWCDCEDLPSVLVRHGLFPTAPLQPRTAISLHLLDFYRALFERSCDAVHALASALNIFYGRRGFILTDNKGSPIQDAFRRGLGYAAQWYDNLQLYVEQALDKSILDADIKIQAFASSMTPVSSPIKAPSPQELSPAAIRATPLSTVQLHPEESQLNDIARGGDIHVCIDGNFNHRHLRSAGDSPHFYDPSYILPKSFVDKVGLEMDNLRTIQKPRPRNPVVPDEAIDECESSHVAGKGSNVKTNMTTYDDGGLMALVCRHDIPIVLANIDTPEEQQKYAVSMLQWLFSLLPSNATVVLLYDVGCVLNRSLQNYDFLSQNIMNRLLLATSVMHAFVHQWACQIANNPRLRTGLGLTDGEGVERLWSRMRKLIGITRSCGREQRLYIIDRQVASIGTELRKDLGVWLRRRLSKGIEAQRGKARQALDSCGVEEDILRSEWELQRASQLSVRAQAPARLKKELDTVLSLQGDLETCEKTLQATRITLAKSLPSPQSLRILGSLQEHHERLKDDIEELYSSLSIQDSYPELHGVDLDFVKHLLIARDLKMNVRKRAIGSFFEWERIDQASGGRDQPLGTKLHQATRAAIKKRAPALSAGLRKYNDLCATLATMYNPEWKIPLPEPLPTELRPLRDAPSLMEDVWISRPADQVPPWLGDNKVREGIRAMLKSDRCVEEGKRLQMEADNLARWFGRELAAIELALIEPCNALLQIPLQQRRLQLLSLRTPFSSPLAPQSVFDTFAQQALGVALKTFHASHGRASYEWQGPSIFSHEQADNFEEEDGDGQIIDLTAEEILFADYLETAADLDATEGDAVGSHVDVRLIWEIPVQLDEHPNLLRELELKAPTVGSLEQSHSFPYRRGSVVFSPRELQILQSPKGRLNDICINGICTLLAQQYSQPMRPSVSSARRCTVFSTYDLPMMQNNASDAEIWRRTRHTEYWSHEVWILPIHRPATLHWVMCTIYLTHGQIYIFDSLAEQQPWKKELQDVVSFVARLLLLAKQNGKSTPAVSSQWIARPTVVQPKQTNSVDCGIWVIANVAAVLAGYATTGMVEYNILDVRTALLNIICTLSSCE